ncbi:MAG TPA: AraC family transcriptional regulator [Chthoniobacteraceae bacterium]|nr:AraC family transcriptional regulator [Chthoniobacteraceae bacterium]
MTHILTEVLLEPPFQRLAEAMTMISLPLHIKALQSSRIIFILNGSCLIRVGEWGPQVFQKGDILFLPMGTILNQEEHREGKPSTKASRNHRLSLYIPPVEGGTDDPLAAMLQEQMTSLRLLPHSQTSAIRSLISEIRHEAQASLAGASIKINALVRCLALEAIRQIDQGNTRHRAPARSRSYIANQAKEYISKNFHQPLRLADVAWHVNLSEEHLCRLFKAETGMTLFHFLTFYRIEESKDALMQSNRSIAEIATKAGFSSPALYSRQFKLHSGMSPKEYRLAYGGRFGLANTYGSRM